MTVTQQARRRSAGRPHLLKRGDLFYYRRRLPMELAGASGRAEITRSLRTTAYRRACAVATLLDARVERFLQTLRRARRVASDETIRRLCERFYAEILNADRESRRTWKPAAPDLWDGGPAQELHLQIGDIDSLADDERERMAAGDRRGVVEDARRLAQEAGAEVEGEDFDLLLYELQRTLVRALGDCAREWEADFYGRLRMIETVGALSLTPPGLAHPVVDAGGGKWLGEAVEAYLAEKRTRWAAKTYDETAKVLGWFVQWVGSKRPRRLVRS